MFGDFIRFDRQLHWIKARDYFVLNIDLLLLFLHLNDINCKQMIVSINKSKLWQEADWIRVVTRPGWPRCGQLQILMDNNSGSNSTTTQVVSYNNYIFKLIQKLCFVYDLSFEMAVYFVKRAECNKYELNHNTVDCEFVYQRGTNPNEYLMKIEDCYLYGDDDIYNDDRRTIRGLKKHCYPISDKYSSCCKLFNDEMEVLKDNLIAGLIDCDQFGYITSIDNESEKMKQFYKLAQKNKNNDDKTENKTGKCKENKHGKLKGKLMIYDQIDWKNNMIFKMNRNWKSNEQRRGVSFLYL